MIKIALAEDNALLAKSIEEKLSLFDDLTLRHWAKNGQEIVDFLDQNVSPSVVLMDIQMPKLNGIEATRQIKAKHPQTKIIMLTVFDDEQNIFDAIQAGANGYLLKDATPDEIYTGIIEILNGGAPMSPVIAARALKLLRNPKTVVLQESDYNLTKREIEILEQLGKGLSYQQIADNLIISTGTVRKHIENIYKKLEVHNKVEAVSKAQNNRII